MTTCQRWIYKYVKQHYEMGEVNCTMVGNGSVKVTDKNGDSTTLTTNLYGDIMNAKTKEILAESDVSNNLDELMRKPYAQPKSWKEMKL